MQNKGLIIIQKYYILLYFIKKYTTIVYSKRSRYTAVTSFCRAAVRHIVRRRIYYRDALGAATHTDLILNRL